jgi:four helix bundle protein
MPRNFKNIKAWQYADDLTILIYSKTKAFPKEESYGITSQLRRAAVSIPTNIAEGASREHRKEYLNYLYIARSSIAEIEYLLHFVNRIGYLKNDDYKQMEDLRQEAAKTLYGLINSVKQDTNKTKDRS